MNSTGSYSENLRGGAGGKRLRQLPCTTYRRCFQLQALLLLLCLQNPFPKPTAARGRTGWT